MNRVIHRMVRSLWITLLFCVNLMKSGVRKRFREPFPKRFPKRLGYRI